ncbi:hypothetical protein BJ742DRAFT_834007 [Cladochytrium replicatum]|nr:hypothetical protein BJ742DRAFT_834007 [Cladochytrium replicatum]
MFANKIILVLGATGNVGSGAVAAFLEADSTVIAPSRSIASLDALRGFLVAAKVPIDKLVAKAPFDLASPSDVKKLREEILKEFEVVDHVVSSSGPFHMTPPLHETSIDQWKNSFGANVDAHFYAWREFGPLVFDREGTSYTIVNGGAARWPEQGITSITANAVEGFCRTVFTQTTSAKTHFNALMISVRVEKDVYNMSEADAARLALTMAKLSDNEKQQRDRFMTTTKSFGKIFVAIAGAVGLRGTQVEVKEVADVHKFVEKWA